MAREHAAKNMSNTGNQLKMYFWEVNIFAESNRPTVVSLFPRPVSSSHRSISMEISPPMDRSEGSDPRRELLWDSHRSCCTMEEEEAARASDPNLWYGIQIQVLERR